MAKYRKSSANAKGQPYDTTLKTWVKENPAEILPVLLPGAIFQEAIDIERIKPTMRADRVFKVLYRNLLHILHIEFESGSDANMPVRLNAYNAILHLEYGLPIISIIIYPFRTTMAKSPYVIDSGDENLTTFHFKTLPLFTQEAERYVKEHRTCMYPMLPAMQGANANLIAQAMEELASLYREDEVSLSQQFVWMELLLERTDTISSLEKVKVQEKIDMYDPLWDEHPKVKKIKAENEAKLREKELRTLQEAIVNFVRARFPDLAEEAQKKVEQINSPDTLNFLLVAIGSAADETVARHILHPSAA